MTRVNSDIMTRVNSESSRSVFQFKKPFLKESIFIINDEFNGRGRTKQKMKLKTEVPRPEAIGDSKKRATVVLTVTNFKTFELLPDKTYLLRISMESSFEWFSGFDDQEESWLLKVNVLSLLLSYIRPLVSELTGLSKFESEYLPFIDFTTSLPGED